MVRLWRTVGGAALRLPCSCPESSTASTPCFPEWPQLSLHCFNTASTHTHAHTHTHTHTHTQRQKKPFPCRQDSLLVQAHPRRACCTLRRRCTAPPHVLHGSLGVIPGVGSVGVHGQLNKQGLFAPPLLNLLLQAQASKRSAKSAAKSLEPTVCFCTKQGKQPQGKSLEPTVCFCTKQGKQPQGKSQEPTVCFCTKQGKQPQSKSPQSAFVPSKANSCRARATAEPLMRDKDGQARCRALLHMLAAVQPHNWRQST